MGDYISMGHGGQRNFGILKNKFLSEKSRTITFLSTDSSFMSEGGSSFKNHATKYV